jgi:uncharacterized protein HemY
LILGVVGLVVVVALVALALHQWNGDSTTPAQQNAVRGGAAPKAQPQKSQDDADDLTPPTTLENEQVVQLVGEARRQAQDGKFDEAEASLAKAEKLIKGAPQIAAARDEIARLKTPEGRVAAELVRARLAVEHGDRAAAEKSLAEIEKLKPDAPELAELRQTLAKQQDRADRRDDRVKEHLTAMRAAIARGDFATADSELNAASRVDVTNSELRRARREVEQAREEAQKKAKEKQQ